MVDPQITGPFPYSPIIHRKKLTWPGQARVALWVIPNIEVFSLNERMPAGTGNIPDVYNWAARDYGARVGIWRMMEVLDDHGIRATVALNSEVCDAYPQIIAEGQRLDWEFMGHNQSNTRRLDKMDPKEEQTVIHDALSRIERAWGRRPKGWLGSGLQETWHTLDFLAAEGLEYVADWVNDDQPYWMTINGAPGLISLPYSVEINDKPAYESHHRTSDEFAAMICRQFDVLYREGAASGRVMAIALHPYLSGVPHRIGALSQALDYICKHPGVWLATGEEIVASFKSKG